MVVFLFPFQYANRWGLFAARQVAPWILLDPKHTYSYLMKTRYQNPSGPHGGNVDSGARNKGYRFPAPG